METIKISPFKTPVSRICLGTWAMGGWMWSGIYQIRLALNLWRLR